MRQAKRKKDREREGGGDKRLSKNCIPPLEIGQMIFEAALIY